MESLLDRVNRLEQAERATARRLRCWQGALALLALLALPLVLARAGSAAPPAGSLPERVAALEASNDALQSQITQMAFVLTPFSRVGTDVFITGANLNIRNGMGSTGTTNELGNLIVGYNENTSGFSRTGSHNIVVGPDNGWESVGGLVAGTSNRITGEVASVSGGHDNLASGFCASVSWGSGNTASGFSASVGGGFSNDASGNGASVSGGDGNIASGSFASVSGGHENEASGDVASVTGGKFNYARGDFASVSGGANLTQPITNGWSAGSIDVPIVAPGLFRSP